MGPGWSLWFCISSKSQVADVVRLLKWVFLQKGKKVHTKLE
jgi:hypothetical protein